MNLTETWGYLEDDIGTAGVSGRVQRRILPRGRRNVFLALEMPSGNRMLIVRVSSGSLAGVPVPPDSGGLVLRLSHRGDPGAETDVELMLTDGQHRDIFDLLVRDLVEAAEQPDDEALGVARLLARLSEWQQLLRRLSPRGLSSDAQLGVWGELWVLREVLAPSIGIRDAITAWRGPLEADQDFQMGAVCMEVKTSAAHSLDGIPVASERQLEVPEDVVLVLVGLSVDARIGHGETLNEMIRVVRSAATGAGCLSMLDERLESIGCCAEDAQLHDEMGYSVRSSALFLVGPGFPRLVSTDLPVGVSDVRYRIALASCRSHMMSAEALRELLRDIP